jgi:hypothetical protein
MPAWVKLLRWRGGDDTLPPCPRKPMQVQRETLLSLVQF